MRREELQELIIPVQMKLDMVNACIANLKAEDFKSELEYIKCQENLLGQAKAYRVVINIFIDKGLRMNL